MKNKASILVDGNFFLKRYRSLYKIKNLDPVKTANDLWNYCISHLYQKKENFDLYRIFYYDCLPYNKKQHNPISGKAIDFAKTEQCKFKNDFLEELKTFMEPYKTTFIRTY